MISQRMKELRKALHMTQEEFGRAIGLSQGHLTSVESGKRNVTERTIKTVCHTFQANEQWLREGEGEMFLSQRRDMLDELTRAYRLDALERAALEAFLTMDPSQRQGLLSFLNSLADGLSVASNASQEAAHMGGGPVEACCAAHGGKGA